MAPMTPRLKILSGKLPVHISTVWMDTTAIHVQVLGLLQVSERVERLEKKLLLWMETWSRVVSAPALCLDFQAVSNECAPVILTPCTSSHALRSPVHVIHCTRYFTFSLALHQLSGTSQSEPERKWATLSHPSIPRTRYYLFDGPPLVQLLFFPTSET